TSSCDIARSLHDKHVLLLSGEGGERWRDSTLALKNCLAGNSVEAKQDAPVTGLNLPSATGQTEEAYDRPVIEFFDKALRCISSDDEKANFVITREFLAFKPTIRC